MYALLFLPQLEIEHEISLGIRGDSDRRHCGRAGLSTPSRKPSAGRVTEPLPTVNDEESKILSKFISISAFSSPGHPQAHIAPATSKADGISVRPPRSAEIDHEHDAFVVPVPSFSLSGALSGAFERSMRDLIGRRMVEVIQGIEFRDGIKHHQRAA